MDVLELKRVTLEAGGRVLQEDMELTLRAGDRVTLQGPSGCGKSSLLRLVLGFYPPARGEVRILGECLDARTVWKARTRMAWVPQTPDFSGESVRQILDRAFDYHANRQLSRDEEQLRAWMEELHLPEALLDQDPGKLSGGEKQRFALLTALRLNRPLLLLDEAVSALDPANRERVAALLERLKNTAVLAVSHDASGLGIGERFVQLEGGS